MNLKQKLTVVSMDAMLVAELALCMYFGQGTREDLTAFFLKTFLPAMVVTVGAARFLIRRWQDAPPPEGGAPETVAAGNRA